MDKSGMWYRAVDWRELKQRSPRRPRTLNWRPSQTADPLGDLDPSPRLTGSEPQHQDLTIHSDSSTSIRSFLLLTRTLPVKAGE